MIPYLFTPQSSRCPCPGEIQSSEERRVHVSATADHNRIVVTWKDAGLDLVRVNISRDVMPSSGPQVSCGESVARLLKVYVLLSSAPFTLEFLENGLTK